MTPTQRFSTTLKERSNAAHADSEHADFMADLVRGQGTRADYVALLTQHWCIYEALEAAAAQMRDDPIAGAFVSDELARLPAIETDLAFLVGAGWRTTVAPLPATLRYVDRIREIGTSWPGGFVAHHYTRYLGDLSGGRFIGRVLARRFGFESAGVGFYRFDGIADPGAFKAGYRERLDAAAWSDAERERIIAEVLLAYRFNTDLFSDLTTAKAASLGS